MPGRYEQPEAVWLVQEPTAAPSVENAAEQDASGPHPLLVVALLVVLALAARRHRARTLEDLAGRRLGRISGLTRVERDVMQAMAHRIGAHPVALLVSESAFHRAQRRAPAEEQARVVSVRRRLSYEA